MEVQVRSEVVTGVSFVLIDVVLILLIESMLSIFRAGAPKRFVSSGQQTEVKSGASLSLCNGWNFLLRQGEHNRFKIRLIGFCIRVLIVACSGLLVFGVGGRTRVDNARTFKEVLQRSTFNTSTEEWLKLKANATLSHYLGMRCVSVRGSQLVAFRAASAMSTDDLRDAILKFNGTSIPAWVREVACLDGTNGTVEERVSQLDLDQPPVGMSVAEILDSPERLNNETASLKTVEGVTCNVTKTTIEHANKRQSLFASLVCSNLYSRSFFITATTQDDVVLVHDTMISIFNDSGILYNIFLGSALGSTWNYNSKLSLAGKYESLHELADNILAEVFWLSKTVIETRVLYLALKGSATGYGDGEVTTDVTVLAPQFFIGGTALAVTAFLLVAAWAYTEPTREKGMEVGLSSAEPAAKVGYVCE